LGPLLSFASLGSAQAILVLPAAAEYKMEIENDHVEMMTSNSFGLPPKSLVLRSRDLTPRRLVSAVQLNIEGLKKAYNWESITKQEGSEENKDEDEKSDAAGNSRRRRCLSVQVITSRAFKCEANRRPLQAHSYTLTQIHLKTSGSVDGPPLSGNIPLPHSGILDFTTMTHGVVI
jgi:hypothetical protein